MARDARKKPGISRTIATRGGQTLADLVLLFGSVATGAATLASRIRGALAGA